MQTLSHGYKKPANPDTGDVFFPAMELNIQLLNDHTHNGTDGNLISVQTQTLLSANWVADVNGLYKQTVTMPAPYTYDASQIEFRLSTGEMVYPSTIRVGSNQYTVYTNDNSKTYNAIYR